MTDALDQIPWGLICDRIRSRECTFFLGSGVNSGKPNDEQSGLPIGSEVAVRLLNEELGPDASKALGRILSLKKRWSKSHPWRELCQLGAEDLAKVAQYVELRNDKPHVATQLAKLIPDHTSEPSEVLSMIAKLVQPDPSGQGGIKTVISTNYDCHFERALGYKYVKLIDQPTGGFSPDEANRINDEIAKSDPPIFYKMHGSFPREDKEDDRRRALQSCSIVASEDDYVEFITAMRRDDVGVPYMITARLSTSTIVFLGYSLADWDFRSVFKGMIRNLQLNERRKCISIQREIQPLWKSYWTKQGIDIYEADVTTFTNRLLKEYEKFIS